MGSWCSKPSVRPRRDASSHRRREELDVVLRESPMSKYVVDHRGS